MEAQHENESNEMENIHVGQKLCFLLDGQIWKRKVFYLRVYFEDAEHQHIYKTKPDLAQSTETGTRPAFASG